MKKKKYDFGILGGDVRQLSTARQLAKAGYSVICYMPDEDFPAQAASLEELIACSEMLVAPLPFCISPDTGTGENFYQFLAKEGQDGQLLFSGPLPTSVKNSLRAAKIRLCNPASDPVFAEQNATLTAEGVVAELLSQHTDSASSRALYKSRILLTGYGKCGHAIAKALSGFSAQLTICDTDKSALEQASSAPGTSSPFFSLHPEEISAKLSDYDFVINTAPCLIFDKKLLQNASKETLFLDIASAPGGMDMTAASELGITARQLPGLPSKVSPEAAGCIYAAAILRHLNPESAPGSGSLTGRTIGIALTGSFCTYAKIWKELELLKKEGAELIFILSQHAATITSRFGRPEEFLEKIHALTDRPPILTIEDAEPIGPSSLLDALVIFPCTGNTAAKLSCGITDTPVLMAAKAHLRNEKPLVLSLSTNDALAMNMKNIGLLLNTRHLYFVPFGQDDPVKKPNSMTAHTKLLLPTLKAALSGKQLQPVILSHESSPAASRYPAANSKMHCDAPLLSAANGGDTSCAE